MYVGFSGDDARAQESDGIDALYHVSYDKSDCSFD